MAENFLRYLSSGLPEIGRIRFTSTGGSGQKASIMVGGFNPGSAAKPWNLMTLSRLVQTPNSRGVPDDTKKITNEEPIQGSNSLWVLGDDTTIITALTDGALGKSSDSAVLLDGGAMPSFYSGDSSVMSDHEIYSKFIFGNFYNAIGTYEDPTHFGMLLGLPAINRQAFHKARNIRGHLCLLNVGGVMVITPRASQVSEVTKKIISSLNIPIETGVGIAMMSIISGLSLGNQLDFSKQIPDYATSVANLVTLHGKLRGLGLDVPEFTLENFHWGACLAMGRTLTNSFMRCCFDRGCVPTTAETASIIALAVLLTVLSSPGSLCSKPASLGMLVGSIIDDQSGWASAQGVFMFGGSSSVGTSVNFSELMVVKDDVGNDLTTAVLALLMSEFVDADDDSIRGISGMSISTFASHIKGKSLDQKSILSEVKRGASAIRKVISVGRLIFKYGKYLL